MRKRKIRKYIFKCIGLYFLLTSIMFTNSSVLATTGNISDDIMNTNRFQGAIDSIHVLTEFMDGGFIWYSTAIAYLMIIISFAKNFLAGLYYAWPTFWDKVYVAHEEYDEKTFGDTYGGYFGKSFFQNIGKLSRKSLGKFILSKFPNIRGIVEAGTDAGTPIGPGQFFGKAIPQLALAVMISACIYNGYTKDVTVLVTDTGAEIFKRVVLQVSPIELIDRLTGMSGTPDFSSENGMSARDEMVYDIASDAYGHIITKYTDVSSAAAKAALANKIEEYCYKWTDWLENKDKNYMDKTEYAITCNTTLVLDNTGTIGSADSNSDLFLQNGKTLADSTIFKATFSVPVADLGIETVQHIGEGWKIKAVVTITAVVDDSNVSRQIVNDLNWTATCTVDVAAGTLSVYIPDTKVGGSYALQINDSVLTDSSDSDIKFTFAKKSKTTLIYKASKALPQGYACTTFNVSGIYYGNSSANYSTVSTLTPSAKGSVFMLNSLSGACDTITEYGRATEIKTEE